MEDAFQQAVAPCVPQLGIGTAYVGNGQKVERAEAFVDLVSFAEGIEYVGVLDVFFCGRFKTSEDGFQPAKRAGRFLLRSGSVRQ